MTKRIIAAALAVLMLSGLAACRGTTENTETTASTEASSAQASTTVTETVTSTAATTQATTAESTTVTEIVTKVLTTVKKVTTTKKPTTTKETTTEITTHEPETESEKHFYDYRIEENTYEVNLKYGVVLNRAATSYIEKQDDGSEVIVKETYSDYYNRFYYSADYEDLLPAARENEKTYSSEINRILEITNGYRAEKGLPPLKLSKKLTEIACARAEEIAWSGKHSHMRPNGKFFSSIIKEAGIEKGTAGENIGWGYSSAESVCEAWKNSETHYENIMNPDFTEIGIGVAADPDPDGKLCWSQLFLTA